jgi:hypothetical protein
LDEESENMPVCLRKMVLAQYNFQSLQWLVKGAATLSTCRKECNKCDLTVS